MAARAGVLLFLVRTGILNSLNREELEKMALNDLQKAGADPGNVGIPETLGFGRPEYNLDVPAHQFESDPGTSASFPWPADRRRRKSAPLHSGIIEKE